MTHGYHGFRHASGNTVSRLFDRPQRTHATSSLAWERGVARGIEHHVEDDVVQTLVAGENERRGAKSCG
eukprot:6203329-Pleurochrysis_carterae.AAC.1